MTLVREYQPTFVLGDGETKEFSYLFEEVSENFIKVIVKHSDDSTYVPVFSVDSDAHKVVFGESETAPLDTDLICIYRETPDLQDTPFRTLQGYDAKALENILSKIVAMIQELKANGFSTQILQGTPWQLDLLHPADDGASVVVDYNARILKKGLYFQIVSGNLQVSADGVNFIKMPKSADITEFRQLETVLEDLTVQYRLQYKVNGVWYNAESNAEATADEALQIAQDAKDIAQDAKDIADTFDGRLTQAEQDASDAKSIAQTASDNVTAHIADKANPHEVTKAQVGLGNADNTADVDKPISTATQSALDLKANSADLATVATTGSYTDLTNKPTIGDATLTIQKNGTDIDTFTANATVNKTINIPVPTTAADVHALPDTTKYTANASMTINSTTYVITLQLKDQDGNNIGTAQTIDLPLETVVVSGSYDSATKEVVLTLKDGSTIRFSVADLISGLQSEITVSNKLDADLVSDSTSTNKFVTASDKTTWNGKQDAISDLTTIRSGASAGATAVQPGDLATVATTGSYSDLTNKPTLGTAAAADTTDFATATQGGKADTAVQPGDLATVATTGSYSDLSNKPTIPDAQIQSDWNQSDSTKKDYIKNKPSIPTVGNGTITITQGGVTKGTFTTNQSGNTTVALDAGGGGGADIDNSTITTNAQSKIQAVATINKNSASGATNPIYDWVGTLAEYTSQAVATNHPDWICYITDDVSGGSSVYTKAETDAIVATKIGIPNYTAGTDITINTNYPCPSDGYVFVSVYGTSGSGTLTINGVSFTYFQSVGAGSRDGLFMPVGKNDVVRYNKGTGKFFPCR